ncbi:hypothetical protein VIGAN_10189900, partial [Vigna angularis var. angularis]
VHKCNFLSHCQPDIKHSTFIIHDETNNSKTKAVQRIYEYRLGVMSVEMHFKHTNAKISINTVGQIKKCNSNN